MAIVDDFAQVAAERYLSFVKRLMPLDQFAPDTVEAISLAGTEGHSTEESDAGDAEGMLAARLIRRLTVNAAFGSSFNPLCKTPLWHYARAQALETLTLGVLGVGWRHSTHSTG